MEYSIFNELSAKEPAKDIHIANQWMNMLIETCKAASITGFKQLRTSDDFIQTFIAHEYTIFDWLNDDTCIDRRLKILLMGLLRSPCIEDGIIDEEAYLLMEKICIANGESEEVEGMGIAYLTGTLSISFNSHKRWDRTEIPLVYTFLIENGKPGTHTKKVTVKHASKPEHIKELRPWALKLDSPDFESWEPSLDKLLPRVKTSDMLVDGDWNKFREELKKYPHGKNAIIQEMAKNVAEINGYKYNQELSSHNQKTARSMRLIFEAGRGNGKIYLSTDFETGAFEVCDYRGNHLGEYSFNGKRTKQPDHSGKHNIYLL